jgi:hypothetical protein
MALQSSGAISLNEIHIEAGGTTGTLASINDSDIRGLINKTAGTSMAFNEWYGASSFTATHTLTQAFYDDSSNYYGKFLSGSISPTTFDGYTIRYLFRVLADGDPAALSDFWIYLNGTVPSDALTTVKIECDDATIITLAASDAISAQSGSVYRYWTWNEANFTTAEHASFVSTFDGSGTVDLELA